MSTSDLFTIDELVDDAFGGESEVSISGTDFAVCCLLFAEVDGV